MAKRIGLGSAIKAATKAVGIRPCAGCNRRAARLDAAVPQVWPPKGLNAWLKARAEKRARREAQARKNAHLP